MRDRGTKLAIDAAGGVSHLAALLGVTKQAVSDWERIPAERVLKVEQHTGVARGDLRPDLYPPAQRRKRKRA